MPTTILPVSAIQSLRLTCRCCGAAVVIPLDANNGPVKCFNCARPLPGAEVMKLVGELRWLRDYTASPNAEVSATFDAAPEHDQAAV
jgi:hypothetical protein